MAKTYQYCVAENWGKGFIDHVESSKNHVCRLILVMFGKFQHTTNTVIFGLLKLLDTVKTRDEAQAIVDVEVHCSTNCMGRFI